MKKTGNYCDGEGEIDKNGNPPGSGTASGKLQPCPKCKAKKPKAKSRPKVKLEACKFVPIRAIVPEGWEDWFYNKISQNAPFSWGDNNRTLVTASRLADHCKDAGLESDAGEDEVDAFMDVLGKLGQAYVDLEN